MKKAEVFVLTDESGKLLDPSVQATILAKYSRSPDSAKDIVKLSPEEANKFHDKWTISYGHSSVAELANIPICFENVSIIASKFLEKWQRPGYSEKSTRYQKFSSDSFITPPGAPSTMHNFASKYFEAYQNLYPKVLEKCAKIMGLDPSLAKVKARAFDNVRYLLPAGTGTNLAAVINLRDLRYVISEARGHSNPEIRNIGELAFEAGSKICPTLLKEALPDSFEPRVKKLDFGASKDKRVVLYEHSDFPMEKFRYFVENVYGMNWDTFQVLMNSRHQFKSPKQAPDVFKEIRLKFNIVMDYGAYRDLQRHRRLEQFAEPLTPYIGYEVPDDIAGTELEPEYRRAMELVSSYDDSHVINDFDLMQYMVPLGYLHRSTFSMDMKELYYLTELRTKPQGHISYRRIAYEIFELAKEKYPEIMKWCQVVKPDTIGDHNLPFNHVQICWRNVHLPRVKNCL